VHLRPDLSSSTTWTFHIKNMEEKTELIKGLVGLEHVVQASKDVLHCIKNGFSKLTLTLVAI
jgi:hypothetical protein